MADKMLIDASHEEETRVVVVRGNRIEEFDFESEHKKQIRGNIYLAKVTRVEPSLQAAFVDYGGNRHGFLAFAEIHPDYYQIPLADRQALLRAEAEEHEQRYKSEDGDDAVTTDPGTLDQPEISPIVEPAALDESISVVAGEEPAADVTASETAAEPAAEEAPAKKPRARRSRKKVAPETTPTEDAVPSDVEAPEAGVSGDSDEGSSGEMAAMVETDTISEDVDVSARNNDDEDDDHADDEVIESVGAEDAMEEVPDRAFRKPRKQYRIQDVIKRRQILLVQVAKEERGNKGAALTTYLSLAGRYSVLMPNTARGGGISRKITNPQDRKRLKDIAKMLEVPQGMGIILRTAGANRTKVEIKRDYEYLMRLWENVRTLTLQSTAPCLVYEEGSLIKRSIRDLYNKDIGEIIVAGEEGYREAKDFMKMLMPSHAKMVQPYRDIHPIFARSGIEAQLDRMLQPQVTLKSGGYLIINQTEALVSIDVNSGRSTREHSIEDTALQTNLEAAEEIARQLRLRDLAGLVVIDFIDMEENRNNRAVEKKLKECLKSDRARIQVGRISHFGLLEMSRQRIRASVLESTTQVCSHCGGSGHVRSQSSIALHVLRGVEEYLLKNTTHNVIVRTIPDIALYLLNHKRQSIIDYENRFGVSIMINADTTIGNQHFVIDRGEPVENPVRIESLFNFADVVDDDDDVDIVIEIDEDEDEAPGAEAGVATQRSAASTDEDNQRKRKRRRRRRGRNGNGNGEQQPGHEEMHTDTESEPDDGDSESADASMASDASVATEPSEDDETQPNKRRRRGKRGGRRNRPEDENDVVNAASEEALTQNPSEATVEQSAPSVTSEDTIGASNAPNSEEPTESSIQQSEETRPDEDKAERTNRASNIASSEPVVTSNQGKDTAQGETPAPAKPKKAGWWQRRGFF